MANSRNKYIFIPQNNGYLTNHKEEYKKELNKMELFIETDESMIEANTYTTKQANNIVGKIKRHNVDAFIIKPFVIKDVFKLNFPYDGLLSYYTNIEKLNIFSIKDLELDPDDFESDKSSFYFTNKDDLKRFIVNRTMYLKNQFHDIIDHNYNCFLEKIEDDSDFKAILRDKTIDEVL